MDDEHNIVAAGPDGAPEHPPELVAMFTWARMTVRVVATYPAGMPAPGPFYVIEGCIRDSMGGMSWTMIGHERMASVVLAAAHEIQRLRLRNRDLELAFMDRFGADDRIITEDLTSSAAHIASSIRLNHQVLMKCHGPHSFKLLEAREGEAILRWRCERCGGVMSNPQRHIYELGFRHAKR